MKKLIVSLLILLAVFSPSCKKEDTQPQSQTTGTAGYQWGSQVMLQGHYNFGQSSLAANGDFIGGFLEPNPDGTFTGTREVLNNATQIDKTGGTYKFDYKRLQINVSGFVYLGGDWQVNTYSKNLDTITITKLNGETPTSMKATLIK